MKSLKEWYEVSLEVLKAKNKHLNPSLVQPLYGFYLLMKSEYGEYSTEKDWTVEYKEYLDKYYKI